MAVPLSKSYVDTLVVFVNHTECRWLTWLRPGFRHCFAAVRIDHRWVVCDALKSSVELHAFDLPSDFDLASFYSEKGHVVVIGTRMCQPNIHRLTIEPLTCVAITKRVIGLQSIWVQTPWQLFRVLLETQDQEANWQLFPQSGGMKATAAGLCWKVGDGGVRGGGVSWR